MKRLPLVSAVDHLENAASLDPLVNGVRLVIRKVLQPRWFRDILHGVPLGHPLHPVLVQLPIGAWTSAALLDLLPGTQRASRALVGMGVVAAAPAALAGYTDWSTLHVQQQRVGVVHSSANLLAVLLYGASYLQRVRGRGGSGKALAYAGFALAGISASIGGHLSFRQASGANHAESVRHRFPGGWHPVGPIADIADGKLEERTVEGQSLLVYRQGERVRVLSDTCSHLSGPLHEGRVLEENGPCVECPWHQSVFSLETGEVVHGPATVGQPRFVTRVTDGTLEVCLSA